ncbi:hypothetical protein JTE90_025945 [Oedothorax gibbosus]|uniref:Transposase n=1 Tax=Oedothorax gibbosus TaxID=931172 RepID=A0AAV6TR22_9ARAC|nr:hypothetical protein JTE90_025945 [Oedothorax gibbosus]
MRHKVQHPNDKNRFLFLSFDPCHIIKNIRSQFLEKEMGGKESYITGNYVKKVYELQKDQTGWKLSSPLIWKKSKKESEECEKDFLTPETYSALLLTSLSTVACVKYLLENGFHYVLTRRRDPVESLFSAVRQMNGGNDGSDAKASTVAINKILRTGLLLPHHSSNVPVSSFETFHNLALPGFT